MNLTIRGGTHGTNFTVEAGLAPGTLVLRSTDGRIRLTVPTDMFTFLTPGSAVMAFISMTQVVPVEPEPEGAIVLPKLIGKSN